MKTAYRSRAPELQARLAYFAAAPIIAQRSCMFSLITATKQKADLVKVTLDTSLRELAENLLDTSLSLAFHDSLHEATDALDTVAALFVRTANRAAEKVNDEESKATLSTMRDDAEQLARDIAEYVHGKEPQNATAFLAFMVLAGVELDSVHGELYEETSDNTAHDNSAESESDNGTSDSTQN